MRLYSTKKWVLIRIHWSEFSHISIEVDKRIFDKGLLYNNFGDKQLILRLPHFNIFAGSLTDLEKKIKKLAIFT